MPEIAELPSVMHAAVPEVATWFRVSHSHRQARYPRPSRPRLAGNHVADGSVQINRAPDGYGMSREVLPFAIGGKNCLFFASDRSGKALAILASFTETCKKFAINPWQYLKDILECLPVTPNQSLYTLLVFCHSALQSA